MNKVNQLDESNKFSKTALSLTKSNKYVAKLDPLGQNSKESIGRNTNYSQFGGHSQMIGSKIAKLQEQGNFFAKKIESESNKLLQLEQDIEKIQQEIEDKRKQIIENKRTRSDNDPEFLQSKIKANNVKIEALRKKINEQIAQNNSIKEQVNDLRREKNIYDKIYQDLQIELQEKKKRLRQILQESKNAKEEIRLGKQKLEKFQQEAIIDKEQFEQEINSVFQIVDLENREDKMRQNFNQAIDKSKVNQKSNVQDSNYGSTTGFAGFITQPEGLDTISPSQKKKIQKERENRLMQRDLNNMEQLKKDVGHYEEVFSKLKAETGTDDMDEIVKKLVDCEEENYSLYKYINALRDEQESLLNQEKAIQKEIDELTNFNEKDKQDPKTQKIFEIQSEIDQINQKKKKYLQSQLEMSNNMNELKVMLPVIFERIGCNNDQYKKELGFDYNNPEELNDQNILLLLSVIEKRTHDLITVYNSKFGASNVVSQRSETADKQNNNTNRGQSKHSNQRKTEDLEFVLDNLKEEPKNHHSEKQRDEKKIKEVQQQFEVTDKYLMDEKELRHTAKYDLTKVYGIASKSKINQKKKPTTGVNNLN